LDGGYAFYGTYKTKDGKYIAVGALEPQFFRDLVTALGLSHAVSLEDQFDADEQEKIRSLFASTFLSRTRDEWDECFEGLGIDACVSPVLEMHEAPKHPLALARKSFVDDSVDDAFENE
jgi:alpha-methylacyl-CoA racemase